MFETATEPKRHLMHFMKGILGEIISASKTAKIDLTVVLEHIDDVGKLNELRSFFFDGATLKNLLFEKNCPALSSGLSRKLLRSRMADTALR